MDNHLSHLLKRGAFLTVKSGGRLNTMTIGWGFEGTVWHKPSFAVFVRKSRYTYELLKDAQAFTVCIPKEGELKEALKHFGTVSARDGNKYARGFIEVKKAKSVDGFVVAGCEFNYECNVVFKQELSPEAFTKESIPQKLYSDGDLHVLFIGEIVEIY